MNFEEKLAQFIRDNKDGVAPAELKKAFQRVVSEHYGPLPPWSTLQAAKIQDVETATVGSGVAIVFQQDGVWKTLVGQAGDHYKRPDAAVMPEAYTIPGGFINLSSTPGSSLVSASSAPEDGRTGAAREVEEEFRDEIGAPLLVIDPARLTPVDTKTLMIGGSPRIVMGFMLVLNAAEIAHVTAHVARLASDEAYRTGVAAHSINPASRKPEIATVRIFDLADVVDGVCPLLHADQKSLFALTQQTVSQTLTAAPRPKKCCGGAKHG